MAPSDFLMYRDRRGLVHRVVVTDTEHTLAGTCGFRTYMRCGSTVQQATTVDLRNDLFVTCIPCRAEILWRKHG